MKKIDSVKEDSGLIISELFDSYIQKRQLGIAVDKSEVLEICPLEFRAELEEEIDGWEWMLGGKYDGSVDDIDDTRLDRLALMVAEAI